MRFVLLVVAALLLSPARAEARVWNMAELEGLLAPVALQPDPILFQVLDASLVPHEVFDAAQAGGAPGPWSQPVQALRGHPELLSSLAQNKAWLFDLGNAWLGQRNDVLATVGVLRQRAAAGTLTPAPPAYAPVYAPAYVVVPAAPVVQHVIVHRPVHVHRHVHRPHRPPPNGPPSPAAQLQREQAGAFQRYHKIPEAQRKPIVQQHYPQRRF